MSDYLGNLITRTLSHEASVRPRLPSRFEVTAANRSTGFELEGAVAPDVTPAMSPAPEHKPGPAVTSPDRREQSEPPTVFASTGEASNQDALTLPGPQPANAGLTIAPAIVAIDSLHAQKDREPSQTKSIQSEITVTSSTSDRENLIDKSPPSEPIPLRVKAEAKHFSTGSREPTPTGRRNSDASDRQTHEDLDSVSSHSAKSAERDIPKSPKPTVKVEKVRAVEAVVPVARNLFHAASPPVREEPPAINVTIGRVEIRATTPPPPLQKAQPKSAKVLSLESYLQQRAKGDRR